MVDTEEVRVLDVAIFEGGGSAANTSKVNKSWVRQGKTESQRNKREAKKL